ESVSVRPLTGPASTSAICSSACCASGGGGTGASTPRIGRKRMPLDATDTSGFRAHRPHPYEFAGFHVDRPKVGRLQRERDRGYRRLKQAVEPSARRGSHELQRHLDLVVLVEHLCLVGVLLDPLGEVGNSFTQLGKSGDIATQLGLIFFAQVVQLVIKAIKLALRRQRLAVAVAHW